MKVKELRELLEKFPDDCDVIYDGFNQLENDGYCLEYIGKGDEYCNRDFDGQIEDFYVENVEGLSEKTSIMLLCLTAKPKESRGT